MEVGGTGGSVKMIGLFNFSQQKQFTRVAELRENYYNVFQKKEGAKPL